MPDPQWYGFHDLAGIRVETTDRRASGFFAEEYRHATGSLPKDAPVVSLTWRRHQPAGMSLDGFQFNAHKFLARWHYRIAASHEKIDIEAVGNRLAIPMVHHMLLHPSLRLLCSRRGVLMLHAAAVVHRGKSLIFCGEGGAGKTTTSSLILAAGGTEWNLHADDYVFWGEGGETFSYVTRSHLYRDLARWVPGITDRLTLLERLQLLLFGLLRAWTRDGIKLPVRVSSGRLWEGYEIKDRAKLGALIILERAPIAEVEFSQLSGGEIPVDELLRMNFTEARHFIRLVQPFSGQGFDRGWLEEWKERESDLLRSYSRRSPVYRLRLPQDVSRKDGIGVRLLQLLEPVLREKELGSSHG